MSDCLLKRDWGLDFRLWHAMSFRCRGRDVEAKSLGSRERR